MDKCRFVDNTRPFFFTGDTSSPHDHFLLECFLIINGNGQIDGIRAMAHLLEEENGARMKSSLLAYFQCLLPIESIFFLALESTPNGSKGVTL